MYPFQRIPDPACPERFPAYDGTVTEYVKGEPRVLEAKDGYYEFTLGKGQGTFVTVEYVSRSTDQADKLFRH